MQSNAVDYRRRISMTIVAVTKGSFPDVSGLSHVNSEMTTNELVTWSWALAGMGEIGTVPLENCQTKFLPGGTVEYVRKEGGGS